jgi:hypothetical protein
MAKAGKKTSIGVPEWSTPTLSEIHFASATLGAVGGLESGAKRFGELVDDLKSPAGTPRKYDYAAIIAVAEEAIKLGVDAHQSWFFDRVRDMCGRRRPPVATPLDDSSMRRIVGHVYKRGAI